MTSIFNSLESSTFPQSFKSKEKLLISGENMLFRLSLSFSVQLEIKTDISSREIQTPFEGLKIDKNEMCMLAKART